MGRSSKLSRTRLVLGLVVGVSILAAESILAESISIEEWGDDHQMHRLDSFEKLQTDPCLEVTLAKPNQARNPSCEKLASNSDEDVAHFRVLGCIRAQFQWVASDINDARIKICQHLRISQEKPNARAGENLKVRLKLAESGTVSPLEKVSNENEAVSPVVAFLKKLNDKNYYEKVYHRSEPVQIINGKRESLSCGHPQFPGSKDGSPSICPGLLFQEIKVLHADLEVLTKKIQSWVGAYSAKSVDLEIRRRFAYLWEETRRAYNLEKAFYAAYEKLLEVELAVWKQIIAKDQVLKSESGKALLKIQSGKPELTYSDSLGANLPLIAKVQAATPSGSIEKPVADPNPVLSELESLFRAFKQASHAVKSLQPALLSSAQNVHRLTEESLAANADIDEDDEDYSEGKGSGGNAFCQRARNAYLDQGTPLPAQCKSSAEQMAELMKNMPKPPAATPKSPAASETPPATSPTEKPPEYTPPAQDPPKEPEENTKDDPPPSDACSFVGSSCRFTAGASKDGKASLFPNNMGVMGYCDCGGGSDGGDGEKRTSDEDTGGDEDGDDSGDGDDDDKQVTTQGGPNLDLFKEPHPEKRRLTEKESSNNPDVVEFTDGNYDPQVRVDEDATKNPEEKGKELRKASVLKMGKDPASETAALINRRSRSRSAEAGYEDSLAGRYGSDLSSDSEDASAFFDDSEKASRFTHGACALSEEKSVCSPCVAKYLPGACYL